MKSLAFAFSLGILAGCATGSHPIAAPDIQIVTDLPPNTVVIERVTATVCVKRTFDMPPSDVEALDELKRVASQKPISGLYKVKFGPVGLISRCGVSGGKQATALTYRSAQ